MTNEVNFTTENNAQNIIYTISDAADILGVTYRTLHYWEDKFDLPINRDASGQRQYSYNDMKVLELIIDAKKNGMNLEGIKNHLIKQGILKPKEDKDILVIDENATELQETLLQRISSSVAQEIRQELQETNGMIKEIVEANKSLVEANIELQEQIQKMQRQSDEHYSKIDQRIAAWREQQEQQQPWYKKIFNK